MIWTILIKEANQPGLTEIQISAMLRLNGLDYAGISIIVVSTELEGLTPIEKKQLIVEKLKNKCTAYIKTYNAFQNLKTAVEGQEIAAQ